ncbi:MAG: polymerase subunit sigma-24 [Ilumatobacteraceae bacterium]|nr:polymerase subunit sigma-24 [Ilumatobacteraceae bacterium]
MPERWSVTSEDEFIAWYDATVRPASGYAARLCGPDRSKAEDLVQDAYLSLLRRSRSGALTEASVGLITTTIRNRFLDGIRSSKSEDRRLRLVAVTDAPTDTGRPVDDESSRTDPTAHLSERDRAALVLRYVDGLSVAEVAGELGLTVHAAESLLTRAKSRARGGHRRHG